MAKSKNSYPSSGSYTTSPNLQVASSTKVTVPLATVYDPLPPAAVPVANPFKFPSQPPHPLNVNLKKLRFRANHFNIDPYVPDVARALICAKRRIRKEVLFATRRTKKGAGAKRTRNHRSRVSC